MRADRGAVRHEAEVPGLVRVSRDSAPRARRVADRAGLAIVLALTLVVAAACGSSTSQSSSTAQSATNAAASITNAPYRILFIGDFSGATKFYGGLEYEGLQIAASYWNQHGGIGGRKIVITKLNDGGDPSTAATDLIGYTTSHSKPNWVYAGTLSNELQALLPILKRENLLGGGLGDTSNVCADAPAHCPSAFSEGPVETQDAAAAANYIAARHFKKAGLLAESNADTQTETTLIAADLKAQGIPSKIVTFPATAQSVTPEVDALKGAGTDVLFVAALGPAVGYAAKARSQLGWSAPVMFDQDASSSDITKVASASQLNGAVEQVYNSMDPRVSLPGRGPLIAAAKQFGGIPGDVALDVLAYPWDDMVTLHDAAVQAGSIDPQAMINAMNNLSSPNKTDPLYLLDKRVQFTTANHENVAASADDYKVIPVGPLVNGQVQ